MEKVVVLGRDEQLNSDFLCVGNTNFGQTHKLVWIWKKW